MSSKIMTSTTTMETDSTVSSSDTLPGSLQKSSTEDYKLQVDFTWRKFKAQITSNSPTDSQPSYIVDFKTLALKEQLQFHAGNEESSPFATGTLHVINIDCDCHIHDQPIKIKALRRWLTSYAHESRVLKKADGSPMTMEWTSSSGWKTWDFICLDENKEPVAKFSANIWATNKVGNIEFLKKAQDVSPELRDEIVVTGLTLFYCMLLRTSSILSFFGAIVHRYKD